MMNEESIKPTKTILPGELDYNLGVAYENGTEGLEKDAQKARQHFEQAALRGHAQAQLAFALYCKCSKNHELSLYWTTQAAEQNCAKAQCLLGHIYAYPSYNGYGNIIAYQADVAISWYRKSIDNGYAEAKSSLNKVFSHFNSWEIRRSHAEPIEYRKDIQLRGTPNAKKILAQLADSEHFISQYHYAVVQKEGKNLIKNHSKKFLEELKKDQLIDNKTRQLFLNQFMIQETRPFLLRLLLNKSFKQDADFNMELADYQYSVLSKLLAKDHNKEEAAKTLALLTQLLKTIPVSHERYAEAELILSHVRYMEKNPSWKKHFEKCHQHDTKRQWVDIDSIPERIRKNTLHHYKKASREERRELKQTEIKKIRENKFDIQALFKLSLISHKRRASCESSIRAIDSESPLLRLCMAR